MIVRLPTNIYERDILNIIKTRDDFTATRSVMDKETGKNKLIPIWPEGEKSIIYDLCVHDVPNFIHINWPKIDLNAYVTSITRTYNKHKTMVILNLVSCCINDLKLGYKTKVQNGELLFLETEE